MPCPKCLLPVLCSKFLVMRINCFVRQVTGKWFWWVGSVAHRSLIAVRIVVQYVLRLVTL
jgi:hypothetical protein